MCGLTRDGTAEPVSRDQILRCERDILRMYSKDFQLSMDQPGKIANPAGTYYVCIGQYFQLRIDQPGKVANPARGQHFPCHSSRLRIWSRETGSAVPFRVTLLISILRLNLVHGSVVCGTTVALESMCNV